MAVELLKHAINMILNNIGEAIRASALPMAILIGIAVAFGGSLDSLQGVTDVAQISEEDIAAIFSSALILMIAYLVLFGWLAVTWHRFILLGDYPGLVPAFAPGVVGPYILQLIVLGAVIVGVALAIGLVASLLGAILPALSLLVGLAMVVILGIVYLRLALTLPAVAVGKKLGMVEAWNRTGKFAQTFVGVFFLLALLRIVAALPGLLLDSIGMNIVAVVVDMLASWFTLMVSVGILTTLYGHIVEGRELN